jgi:8-oxo-dGTP pyrophosphatase MutT (NUDIX family)
VPTIPHKLLGAAAVILDGQGRVLLVKHNYGRHNWELPGGLAEERESLAETAIREVREETGLAVRAEALTGLYYEPERPHGDMHHGVFLCVPEDAAAVPQPDAREVTACGYWPPDALPRPISDFTIRRIEDALSPANRCPLPVTIGRRRWLE